MRGTAVFEIADSDEIND